MWDNQDPCSVITSFIVFSKLPSSQNDNLKNKFIQLVKIAKTSCDFKQ